MKNIGAAKKVHQMNKETQKRIIERFMQRGDVEIWQGQREAPPHNRVMTSPGLLTASAHPRRRTRALQVCTPPADVSSSAPSCVQTATLRRLSPRREGDHRALIIRADA